MKKITLTFILCLKLSMAFLVADNYYLIDAASSNNAPLVIQLLNGSYNLKHIKSILNYDVTKTDNKIIQEKYNVNEQNDEGNSALHVLALTSFNIDIARILFNHNIDHTLRNNEERTALEVAEESKAVAFAEKDFATYDLAEAFINYVKQRILSMQRKH